MMKFVFLVAYIQKKVIVYFSWINSSVSNAAANFSDYCGTSKHSPIAVVS